MNVELLNTIVFEIDDKKYRVLFNGTKGRFTHLLKEYMTAETLFRPVKFREYVKVNDNILYYEI
jgi:hypothetical protein